MYFYRDVNEAKTILKSDLSFFLVEKKPESYLDEIAEYMVEHYANPTRAIHYFLFNN